MKISDFSIQMGSASYYSKTEIISESLQMWPDTGSSTPQQPASGITVSLSDEGKTLSTNLKEVETFDGEYYSLSDEEKNKIRLLSDFIYILTGKKLKFVVPKLQKQKMDEVLNNTSSNARQGWGISYHYSRTLEEHEQMSFQLDLAL